MQAASIDVLELESISDKFVGRPTKARQEILRMVVKANVAINDETPGKALEIVSSQKSGSSG
jgi:hypothetical protein